MFDSITSLPITQSGLETSTILAIISISITIISTLISIFLAPSTPKPKQKIQEFEIPASKIGINIPVVFGTRLISGPIVAWWGDVKIKRVKL